MKEIVKGNNYNYIIQMTNDGDDCCFEILSEHKSSRRKSSITNLNFILSNIVSEVMNEMEIEESWIDTDKMKAEKLIAVAKNCFKNKKWIKILEPELDADRMYGEWSAGFKF